MSPTPIHPAQAFVDGMNAAYQRERAGAQLTLGLLIATLETLDAARRVCGLGKLMSYRGYYCDLAFEPTGIVHESVGELLARCRDAMGRTFQGYKGGDYVMGEATPVWVAPYGTGSGDRLMALNIEADPITIRGEPEP